MTTTLSVDVGGSDLKLATLDPTGAVIAGPLKTPTPRPATPEAILGTITEAAAPLRPFDRVAVGFPGVVVAGVAMNAPNLDHGWDAVAVGARLTETLGCQVRVANDADVAGLGVLATESDAARGVELVITLGTGMGSSLFVDGALVANLELGQHPFDQGRSYEGWLGNARLRETGIDGWRQRLLDALGLLQRTFGTRRIYLGGGNARLVLTEQLPDGVRVVGNRLGLVGGFYLYDR